VIASILVLSAMMVLCLAGAVIFGWRGVHYGFRQRRIEVRGQVYEGTKAVAWGVMGLVWCGISLLGMVLAAIMLQRVLDGRS
jgi:hypothetical protein